MTDANRRDRVPERPETIVLFGLFCSVYFFAAVGVRCGGAGDAERVIEAVAQPFTAVCAESVRFRLFAEVQMTAVTFAVVTTVAERFIAVTAGVMQEGIFAFAVPTGRAKTVVAAVTQRLATDHAGQVKIRIDAYTAVAGVAFAVVLAVAQWLAAIIAKAVR